MKRGAFLCLEGIDHSGKSTQAAKLCESLKEQKNPISSVVYRFPDRTTPIGLILDAHLRHLCSLNSAHAEHLLFAANRWEHAIDIFDQLRAGKTSYRG